MPDTAAGEPDKIAGDETLPSAPDPDALNVQGKCGTDHGPDGGIHAGCISAAGQNTDSFDISHVVYLPVKYHEFQLGLYGRNAAEARKRWKTARPEGTEPQMLNLP